MRSSAVPLLLFAAAFAASPAPVSARTDAPAAASPSSSAAERAEARLRAGDWDAAIAIGEDAVRVSPDDAPLWRILGEAYGGKARSASLLAQIRLARKCRAAFEKAVALAPADLDARTDLFTFYLEAPGIAGGGAARAREQAEAIARIDPARGHAALGAFYLHEKDLPRAEAEYRAVLDTEPSDADARAGLGAVLLARSRFDEARRLWSGLVGDAELGPIAHYQLGEISLVSGTDLDEGVEHFRRYLASPPRPEAPPPADAEWKLALLFEKIGRRAEAVAALREALRLDPDHAEAKKELKRLGE